MGLLDDYKQLLTNERQNEKIRGLLGIADTVTGADQIRGIPADPRNWTIDDTAKMLNFAGGGIGAIKTYHGSPHKFDAFDMSKIGTGEGAQAYGHGLYFAESPDVAKGYQDKLSAIKVIDSDSIEEGLKNAKRMMTMWGDGDTAKSYMQRAYGYSPEETDRLMEQARVNHSGNLYNVSLEWPDAAREAADPLGPQHFLDFDKGLDEQPHVLNAMKNITDTLPEIYQSVGNVSATPQMFEGKDLYQALINDLGHRPNASKDLLLQGIPGIRYLDGGSRGAGEGSYNYVIFDDKIPRIVERNGKPLKGLLDK